MLSILLESGYNLLLESGDNLLSEESSLSLENGYAILLEDGYFMLLEGLFISPIIRYYSKKYPLQDETYRDDGSHLPRKRWVRST